jgi:hypothetical protein
MSRFCACASEFQFFKMVEELTEMHDCSGISVHLKHLSVQVIVSKTKHAMYV